MSKLIDVSGKKYGLLTKEKKLVNDEEWQANDTPPPDLRAYYNETLKLNHPCNKRRTK